MTDYRRQETPLTDRNLGWNPAACDDCSLLQNMQVAPQLFLALQSQISAIGPASAGALLALAKMPNSTWAINSSKANLAICSGTPGAETLTGISVTAYNYFFYPSIPANSFVWLANNGSGWYVVAAPPATAIYMNCNLAAGGTDFGSVVAALTAIEHNGITISGGNAIEVPVDGVYSIRATATLSGDWQHATWSLGSDITDRLPCTVSVYGQSTSGAMLHILDAGGTRGFGDVQIPAQLTVLVNASLLAGATIGVSIGVNPEGPAATNINWTVSGMLMAEYVGP